ncbi:metalloendoproteinase 3-MMP-like [Cornus florida]|uniref:metalloendoproteinase 3-MMP-like n=1 Tax=Cornus florida TaxID=4283 RepID=UPI00289FD796|nr:metalloendoproteinase 3-MMP-like [Cornus florida]
MAPKLFQPFSCIFLLFLLLIPLFSHAHSSHSKANNSSPFEFLKHLQGCHKGDNVKGLHKLKKYLENFGYLSNLHSKNQTHFNKDDFDDLLESAIKTYQLNYHLKATGILDAPTVSKMMMPRCGVPDIINGRNWTQAAGKKGHHHGRGLHTFHTVSHFAFFPDHPKWPASKTHFAYGFAPNTRMDAIGSVMRAFDKWASATHFTFAPTQDYANADLTISFHSGDQGDDHAFDGAGRTLAHAWAPTDGRFHFDADETWSDGATSDAFDLGTVALHEIGHLLGLDHSSVENAIMYAGIASGITKGLHEDDIMGIKVLYNV